MKILKDNPTKNKTILLDTDGIINVDKVVKGLNLLKNFKLITAVTKGIKMNKTYFCLYKPEDDCECRKPKTGLIKQAKKNFNLDLSKCFLIGDKETDITAGKNAGLKTILIKKENITFINEKPDFITNNLVEAANCTLK